jgi:hypothetical protein
VRVSLTVIRHQQRIDDAECQRIVTADEAVLLGSHVLGGTHPWQQQRGGGLEDLRRSWSYGVHTRYGALRRSDSA